MEEDITAERRTDHTEIGVDQRHEWRANAGLMNISKIAACEVFLQWNVQGMSTSKEELINMIDNYKPIAIAVQETFYGSDFVVGIAGYNSICKQGHFNQRFHGGVAMCIHNSMPYQKIHIKTNLQIIAAQVNVS